MCMPSIDVTAERRPSAYLAERKLKILRALIYPVKNWKDRLENMVLQLRTLVGLKK